MRVAKTLKETAILHRILLECGVGDVRLWRNNVGALQDKRGQWVRYGVCNPDGSDLVGFKRILIGPEHLGTVLAVFTAIEVKGPHGRLTKGQRRFLDLVETAGGIAGMVRSPKEAKSLLTR